MFLLYWPCLFGHVTGRRARSADLLRCRSDRCLAGDATRIGAAGTRIGGAAWVKDVIVGSGFRVDGTNPKMPFGGPSKPPSEDCAALKPLQSTFIIWREVSETPVW